MAMGLSGGSGSQDAGLSSHSTSYWSPQAPGRRLHGVPHEGGACPHLTRTLFPGTQCRALSEHQASSRCRRQGCRQGPRQGGSGPNRPGSPAPGPADILRVYSERRASCCPGQTPSCQNSRGRPVPPPWEQLPFLASDGRAAAGSGDTGSQAQRQRAGACSPGWRGAVCSNQRRQGVWYSQCRRP